MKAIRIISGLTLKEALRNRILYLLFFFAAVLVVSSWIISELTVGDALKIIKDLGLGSIHFLGVLITIFIGIGLVFRELEKRTVFIILSKPVHRFEFLLGKFAGLAVTLLLVLTGLVSVFYVVLFLKGDPNPKFLLAFYLMYLEWLMIAGIAVLFSSFSTPLLSVMLALASFFAGHLSASLLLLQKRIDSEPINALLSALYYMLPNLEFFNIRSQMVHDFPIAGRYYAEVTLYWVLYLGTLLFFSIRIFQKKDLA